MDRFPEPEYVRRAEDPRAATYAEQVTDAVARIEKARDAAKAKILAALKELRETTDAEHGEFCAGDGVSEKAWTDAEAGAHDLVGELVFEALDELEAEIEGDADADDFDETANDERRHERDAEED